jgi:hypothetical protein
MGYLLSQQLVAAGERVLNVPATLASRVRVLGSGQSTKSDPNDARSVAVAALRAPTLAVVRRADHITVCRLLVKHHNDLGRWRNKPCRRRSQPPIGGVGCGRLASERDITVAGDDAP